MPASSASGRGKQASRRRACAPHPGTQARLAYAAAAPAAAEPPPTHTPPAMVRACWVHPRQSCRPPKSRRRRLWPPACRMETGPGCTLARGPGSRQGAGRAAAGDPRRSRTKRRPYSARNSASRSRAANGRGGRSTSPTNWIPLLNTAGSPAPGPGGVPALRGAE